MALPGMGGMGVGGGQAADVSPEQMQQMQIMKYVRVPQYLSRRATTNDSIADASRNGIVPCKTTIAGVMGFGLGGMFGIFMSSMRYDTPLSSGLPGGVGTISDMPVREQLRLGFKDMGRSAFSSAKNFGYIGAIFAGTECCIEGFRAKNDLANGVAAGCLTGGFLAKSAGPQAMAVGCAGFAAFSAAIDAYMRMPSDDRSADPII